MGISRLFAAMQATLFAILIFVAIFFPTLSVAIFVVGELFLFILLVIDYKTSVEKKDLLVQRSKEDILFYKTTNRLEIEITNLFLFPVTLDIKDNLPGAFFERKAADMGGSLGAGEQKIFYYEVIPHKRGAFSVDTIYIRATGRMGLLYKFFTCSVILDLRVYPNVRDLSKYRMMVQKDRLLHHQGRVLRFSSGQTEFESLREYVVGDEFRKINWQASAREQKLIVNQYEPEKNQPIIIMMDTGRAMSYHIKGMKKLDYAIESALILADIVNQKGDLSGLVTFGTSVTAQIKPKKGPAHRQHLIETLYHVETTDDTPNYEAAFQAVNRMQKRRSVVFIFTDFETAEETKDLKRHISLIKGHIPIIILMENFHGKALLDLPDAKTENQFTKASAMDHFQKRKELIKTLNSGQVACVETEVESFAMTAINRYLSVKARGL